MTDKSFRAKTIKYYKRYCGQKQYYRDSEALKDDLKLLESDYERYKRDTETPRDVLEEILTDTQNQIQAMRQLLQERGE
jgi:hypothetical protein